VQQMLGLCEHAYMVLRHCIFTHRTCNCCVHTHIQHTREQIVPRRAGDVESLYTDPAFASQYLNWKATRGLKEMCQDTWRWQSTNPNGYKTAVEDDTHTAAPRSEKSAVSVSASGSLRAATVSNNGNTVPVRGGLKQ
jgi:hypothetical protein